MVFNETNFTRSEFKPRGNILKTPKLILPKKPQQIFKAKVVKKKKEVSDLTSQISTVPQAQALCSYPLSSRYLSLHLPVPDTSSLPSECWHPWAGVLAVTLLPAQAQLLQQKLHIGTRKKTHNALQGFYRPYFP